MSESLKDRVVKAMRGVHDPEIPVNIYDLGLIYRCEVDEGSGRVDVEMTLTAPNCPVADKIPADVKRAVEGVEGVREAEVRLVWEPAWSPDKMTEIAEIELEAMGIDPRRAKEQLLGGGGTTSLTFGRKKMGGR